MSFAEKRKVLLRFIYSIKLQFIVYTLQNSQTYSLSYEGVSMSPWVKLKIVHNTYRSRQFRGIYIILLDFTLQLSCIHNLTTSSSKGIVIV